MNLEPLSTLPLDDLGMMHQPLKKKWHQAIQKRRHRRTTTKNPCSDGRGLRDKEQFRLVSHLPRVRIT